jgi:quercetin dioxygenase-like cupin family protein
LALPVRIVPRRQRAGGAGDIVVFTFETPHRFTAIGDEWLVAICIHAADSFAIE